MSTDTKLTRPAKKRAASAKLVAVEVVADNQAMDLATIQQGIATELERIEMHEAAAKEASLPHKLRIGLYCLQAQQLLALPNDGSRSKGKNQHSKEELLSVADKTSPDERETSFSGWFAAEVKGVSRSHAYKYLDAVKGLGLDHTATPKDLDKALSKARKEAGEKKLSIAKLAHAAPKLPAPPEEEQQDPNSPEVKAGEARVFVAEWTARWDLGVKAAHLEDLDLPGLLGLEEFLRNATDHVKLRIKSAKSAKPGKAA